MPERCVFGDTTYYDNKYSCTVQTENAELKYIPKTCKDVSNYPYNSGTTSVCTSNDKYQLKCKQGFTLQKNGIRRNTCE
jgi:hypothetical protein